MRKEQFVCLLISALLSTASLVHPQQPAKILRLGYVSGAGDPNNPGSSIEAFRQRLRELGYVEGKNILFEYRSAEGNVDRIPRLVAELVQLKVDVLIFSSAQAIRAGKQATKTIPIVMVTTQDPVAAGFIDSLARPGGNITGVTTLVRDLSGKRLELLKETIPGISRVGVLVVADSPNSIKDYQAAARALKISLQPLEVRAPTPDLAGAFRDAAKRRVSALITVRVPLLIRHQKQIAEFSVKNRMPLMSEVSDDVEVGALVSYSANSDESYRRAAVFVDKILKGTKPADLPVEQPMKFELVFNLKTAKQIGLTIPPNVLVRAQKVIR